MCVGQRWVLLTDWRSLRPPRGSTHLRLLNSSVEGRDAGWSLHAACSHISRRVLILSTFFSPAAPVSRLIFEDCLLPIRKKGTRCVSYFWDPNIHDEDFLLWCILIIFQPVEDVLIPPAAGL